MPGAKQRSERLGSLVGLHGGRQQVVFLVFAGGPGGGQLCRVLFEGVRHQLGKLQDVRDCCPQTLVLLVDWEEIEDRWNG